MEITAYFVVLGLLFLFGAFDFWGGYLFGFCFLGFFFRSFSPGRFILIILQQTFASSYETRQLEFLISEEELGIVVRSIFLLLLLKLFYGSKIVEIIMQSFDVSQYADSGKLLSEMSS